MEKRGTAEINWTEFLAARLPAMIAAVKASRVHLLSGGTPSTDRLRSHSHPELCIVLRGTVRIITGPEPPAPQSPAAGLRSPVTGQQVPAALPQAPAAGPRLKVGEMLLVAPNAFHHWAAAGQTARALWLGASPRHLGVALSEVTAEGRVTTLGGLDLMDFPPANRLLTELIGEVSAKEDGWLQVFRNLLGNLNVYVVRYMATGGRAVPAEDKQTAAEIVTTNARLYIQQHFAAPLTLGQVAHHVALSPNYLASLFKRQFGRTIIEHLTETRIEAAKRLLEQTDKKVAEIAYEVGYQSPYYFSRAFKHVVHHSPQAYRLRSRS